MEGVCPQRGGCGGSLSTGWGVWKESVHGVGVCGRSLSTGTGVEGVCPRVGGGVEGVVLRSDCVEGVCYESTDVEGM